MVQGSFRAATAAVLTAAVLAACAAQAPTTAPVATVVEAARPPPKSGVELTGFDQAVRPQDDLYRFVGGNWLAHTEIPADRSNYGSFIILDDQAQEEVKNLIVAASQQTNRAPGSDAQKVGDYYLAFMDTARVESLGLDPLAAELAQIDAIATPRDVARYIGHSQRIGVAQPLAWFSSPDNKNSSVYIGSLYQNGLTMPDRDYYLSPDAKYAAFRAKFNVYVEQMLARAGERNAKSAAARIAALETRLANEQWTKVQNRDPVKTYNPMTFPEYQKLAPNFDWLAFFEGVGAPVQKLDVSQPSFIKGVNQLVKTVPVADWRLYFKFQLLDDYAPFLSAPVCRPRVRFPPAHAQRRERATATLAARRGFHGQQHGRDDRPHVRRGAFPARAQAPHARAGHEPAEDLRHFHRWTRVDESGHQGRGQEEAGEDHREDRLPRQVARLHGIHSPQ